MQKYRLCVSWFENGEPKERGFRVPYDDSWHKRVRDFELKVASTCDKQEGTSVYSTSLDGETTESEWFWNEEKQCYDCHELG